MNGLDLFLENVHLKISWVEKNFNFQRIRFEESWCRHVSLWEVYLVKKQDEVGLSRDPVQPLKNTTL